MYNCTSLEAQIADLADEITYYTHDLDDAVDFEILSTTQLEQNEVWRRSHGTVLARYGGGRDPEMHKLIIRDIIDNEVHDLVATSAKSIAESGVQSAGDVRRQPVRLAAEQPGGGPGQQRGGRRREPQKLAARFHGARR